MTTIRSGAPRVSTTVPTSSTSAPATASSSAPATAGHKTNSTFSAATGSGKSAIQDAFDGANGVIKDTEGKEADTLRDLFKKTLPTGDELQAGIKAFAKLAEDGKIGSQEDADKIQKALAMQMGARQMSEMLKSVMEKVIEQVKKSKRED